MDKYKHHLYPRYMAKKGGIPPWGDPSILVEVTHTQHVMFHWCNYQLWGNLEDKIAFTLLRGQDTNMQKEISSLGGRSGVVARSKMRDSDVEYDKQFRELQRAKGKIAIRKTHSTVSKKRESDPDYDKNFRERQRDRGRKGGKVGGKIWITNGKVTLMIPKDEPIPEGFRRGRDKKFSSKISEANLGNKKGLGWMWITNGEVNRKIRRGDPIPEDFHAGRKCPWA